MRVTIDFNPFLTQDYEQQTIESITHTVEYNQPQVVYNLGLNHWIELHTKKSPTQKWFNDWVNRIPNYSCSCRADFQKILEQHPPDFSYIYNTATHLSPGNWLEGKQQQDWFEWTVLVHNKVNEKLKKQVITLEEARLIWNVQIVDVR